MPAAAASSPPPSGRSAPHFLHLVFSGGLKEPQAGHFFIISSNDGGLKHISFLLLVMHLRVMAEPLPLSAIVDSQMSHANVNPTSNCILIAWNPGNQLDSLFPHSATHDMRPRVVFHQPTRTNMHVKRVF